MFFDEATLTAQAGDGGNGVVAWERRKYIPKGGPSGGNGGIGGDVILEVSSHCNSLDHFRNVRTLKAENGACGGGNQMQGKRGKDLVIPIPPGTLVKDQETKEILFDATDVGVRWTLCKGGKGGKGNACFKSPTNQAPIEWTPGKKGVIKQINLELKLIADIGFVGFPNAGKSSLLKSLTHIAVKVCSYPFTTLHPNLGVIRFDDFSYICMADIPGIIENAHRNKGLGLSFLKHIERTSTLLYVIDISGFEERDPLEDFAILQKELASYDPSLLERPFLIALNKIDVEGAEEQLERFKQAHPHLPLFPISCLTETGVASLLQEMRSLAQAHTKRF